MNQDTSQEIDLYKHLNKSYEDQKSSVKEIRKAIYNKRNQLLPNIAIKSLDSNQKRLYNLCQKFMSAYCKGNYNQAFTYGLKAMALAYRLQRSESWANICLFLADKFLLMGRLYEPVLLYRRIQESEFSQDSISRAVALAFHGDLIAYRGYYQMSLLKYKEAYTIFHNQSQISKCSIITVDMARSYFFYGDYVRAFSLIRKAKLLADQQPNNETRAYTYLAEIELNTHMRDTNAANKALMEYTESEAFQSAFHKSIWESFIVSQLLFESHEYQEGIDLIIYPSIIAKFLKRQENLTRIMILLASYANYGQQYDLARNMLIYCYDHSFRELGHTYSQLFLWLHAMEEALIETNKLELANKVYDLTLKFRTNQFPEISNTIFYKYRRYHILTLLDNVIDEIRNLENRYFYIYGLKINLCNGEIFAASSSEIIGKIKRYETRKFLDMLVSNRGVYISNREILKVLEPKNVEDDHYVRRANNYATSLRRLFLRLCGHRIIEGKHGVGYIIP